MIDEESEKIRAAIALNPVLRARNTLTALSGGEQDALGLAAALQEQLAAVAKGDLANAEAMLFTQAHILDQLFNNLLGNAVTPGSAPHMEMCLKLALKCQTQSRATLETLSAIKNPPVVYAKQANFAAGHQQINNNAPVRGGKKSHNEILESIHGERRERLDERETIEASGSDTAMAALGEHHRPENQGGEGQGVP